MSYTYSVCMCVRDELVLQIFCFALYIFLAMIKDCSWSSIHSKNLNIGCTSFFLFIDNYFIFPLFSNTSSSITVLNNFKKWYIELVWWSTLPSTLHQKQTSKFNFVFLFSLFYYFIYIHFVMLIAALNFVMFVVIISEMFLMISCFIR